VRDVVLRVNREYIRSAAQSDDYRTEPPFKLQGSYRNMNRIAEKVAPIMNDQELESLILSNYENDAQTLTSDTESNLLKLKEMLDKLSEGEQLRWDEIRRTYEQNVKMKAVADDDDPAARILVQLGALGNNLEGVRRTLAEGIEQIAEGPDPASQDHAERLIVEVASLKEGLRQLGEAMGKGAKAAAGPAAPPLPASAFQEGSSLHKVTVQHKVPRSILAVVESQFKLMQQWLEPLTQIVANQDSQQAEIKAALEQCVQHYEELVEELSEAHQTQPKKKSR